MSVVKVKTIKVAALLHPAAVSMVVDLVVPDSMQTLVAGVVLQIFVKAVSLLPTESLWLVVAAVVASITPSTEVLEGEQQANPVQMGRVT
jgi:hypothetical protein